jgi:hypothetical protein
LFRPDLYPPQEFAARNPSLTFAHAYPGAVRTSILTSSESPIMRAASYIIPVLAYPISMSQEDSGEYLLHGLLNSTKGAPKIGARGEDIGMKRYFVSGEARKRLWEHTLKATNL